MRVTSSHIVELAAAATSRAQSKVADATTTATSGLRVQVPSDDPIAWAAAQRERVRATMNAGAGGAILASRADVEQTDAALATIDEVVASARELAVQGASNSATAGDRATLAGQVTSLYKAALAAANTRSSDGHYLLAGTKSGAEPFDASGVYHGDAVAQDITVGEHASQAVNVPGSALTAASGGGAVDVLPELAKLAAALGSSDAAGVQASLSTLSAATTQVGLARGRAGIALGALTSADSARARLQDRLSGVIANLVEADTVGAASTLAQATTTLDVARAVSQHVIAALAPSS